MSDQPLNHLDDRGHARMVDVGAKEVTAREAIAEGELHLAPATRELLFRGSVAKGDALAVARIAGIQAAKRTADLIPLCHPIPTTHVAVEIEEVTEPSAVRVRATVRVAERTGAEMEALVATTVALLALYDMIKAVQPDMRIEAVRLRRKSGGKHGPVEYP